MRDPRVRLTVQLVALALGVWFVLTSTLPVWAQVLAVAVAVLALALALREYVRSEGRRPPPSP